MDQIHFMWDENLIFTVHFPLIYYWNMFYEYIEIFLSHIMNSLPSLIPWTLGENENYHQEACIHAWPNQSSSPSEAGLRRIPKPFSLQCTATCRSWGSACRFLWLSSNRIRLSCLDELHSGTSGLLGWRRTTRCLQTWLWLPKCIQFIPLAMGGKWMCGSS